MASLGFQPARLVWRTAEAVQRPGSLGLRGLLPGLWPKKAEQPKTPTQQVNEALAVGDLATALEVIGRAERPNPVLLDQVLERLEHSPHIPEVHAKAVQLLEKLAASEQYQISLDALQGDFRGKVALLSDVEVASVMARLAPGQLESAARSQVSLEGGKALMGAARKALADTLSIAAREGTLAINQFTRPLPAANYFGIRARQALAKATPKDLATLTSAKQALARLAVLDPVLATQLRSYLPTSTRVH